MSHPEGITPQPTGGKPAEDAWMHPAQPNTDISPPASSGVNPHEITQPEGTDARIAAGFGESTQAAEAELQLGPVYTTEEYARAVGALNTVFSKYSAIEDESAEAMRGELIRRGTFLQPDEEISLLIPESPTEADLGLAATMLEDLRIDRIVPPVERAILRRALLTEQRKVAQATLSEAAPTIFPSSPPQPLIEDLRDAVRRSPIRALLSDGAAAATLYAGATGKPTEAGVALVVTSVLSLPIVGDVWLRRALRKQSSDNKNSNEK